MNLFPHFPLHLNSMALFGLTLLLGLVGGELAQRFRFLPIILGYIFIGFLVGPGGLDIANASVLADARIFVEISLSLILFELGRHLDFRWLIHDKGLLRMAITESGLTFLSVFLIIYFLAGLTFLHAAIAGTIAMATSPAVVMMIASDLSAEGPVTRRTLILTSLNNLFALIIFIILAPMVKTGHSFSFSNLFYTFYQLLGSITLGLIMFALAEGISLLIGKRKENQFILFVSLVVLTTGLSRIFHFSTMFSLFVLGVAARNFDYKYHLMEIDFSWLARLFFILLFVVTGAHLQLQGFTTVYIAVLAIILLRVLSKLIGVSIFAQASNLTKKQVVAISFALTPIAGVAIGMSNILIDFNPEFGRDLLLIITGVVTLLNVLGPIATQLAFITSGETLRKGSIS